jgi:4-aminobutyrate aminotransferase-like enzyme
MKGDIEIDGTRLGLILDVGGYYKNVITLAPSLEISYQEIDLAIALLDRLLHRAMQR